MPLHHPISQGGSDIYSRFLRTNFLNHFKTKIIKVFFHYSVLSVNKYLTINLFEVTFKVQDFQLFTTEGKEKL